MSATTNAYFLLGPPLDGNVGKLTVICLSSMCVLFPSSLLPFHLFYPFSFVIFTFLWLARLVWLVGTISLTNLCARRCFLGDEEQQQPSTRSCRRTLRGTTTHVTSSTLCTFAYLVPTIVLGKMPLLRTHGTGRALALVLSDESQRNARYPRFSTIASPITLFIR